MIVIIMGVSGSGKTTIGKTLAARLGWKFYDGDDFHPPANVEKMRNGIPLSDEDRAGWLDALAEVISTNLAEGQSAILACSALKQAYRDRMNVDPARVYFIYLKGSYELISERMSKRAGHYMKPDMLQSQFASLEEPVNAVTVNISLPPEEIVRQVIQSLQIQRGNQMDIAILGLGVMGRSLALNFERNGFHVAGYDTNPNFDPTVFDGKNVKVYANLADLIAALETPRRILLVVPAGQAVDDAIMSLKPHLAPGDILIDGGNSFFTDTERRVRDLGLNKIHLIGMGVSGGESGALWGPSLMPGGERSAWERVAPLLSAIAAKAEDGTPCVAYIGKGGAGHYVKMVHNGIEYADMQFIAEIYDLLRRGCGLTPAEIGDLFAEWNRGDLRSYLMEITVEILHRTDPETGSPMVDVILDKAGQKGTGKWAVQNALDLGAPIPALSTAVDSRFLSALKAQRVKASALLTGPAKMTLDCAKLIPAARGALYASKVVAYAQGFGMLKMASAEYVYGLDMAVIASIWRAGCIIRSGLLDDISAAFRRDPMLENILLDEVFRSELAKRQDGWRSTITSMIYAGLPAAGLGAALAYYDAYRSERLPAYLLQAQRDYFGAHTFERVDKTGKFHLYWDK